jgi:hypothetical protein
MARLEQVCFEHHVHDDETCFVDLGAAMRRHREWTLAQCEAGWPTPGGAKQHAPIKIEEAWIFCPLCGRQVRE